MEVARNENFTGDLEQIDPTFKDHVKVLASSLFNPKSLIIKGIHGQKVRARDFLRYLQTYINIFNGGTLPTPTILIDAIAETNNLILYNDCLNLYIDSMRDRLNEIDPYFNQTELSDIHRKTKNESCQMFQKARKMGGQVLIPTFLHRLENVIEEKFTSFQRENNEKRNRFKEKSNLYNKKIAAEIREDSMMNAHELDVLFSSAKQSALAEKI
ncbi:atlastin-like [Contarinia nasturtii]|uniref:atlastin-like n=1 Tax=Contarinia nasturtii TaxID=265458 RepID=UPI0012D3B80E|nr:atlastin-like [Contarinia nasturtii]